jgi:hypothetical protein
MFFVNNEDKNPPTSVLVDPEAVEVGEEMSLCQLGVVLEDSCDVPLDLFGAVGEDFGARQKIHLSENIEGSYLKHFIFFVTYKWAQ